VMKMSRPKIFLSGQIVELHTLEKKWHAEIARLSLRGAAVSRRRGSESEFVLGA
jgi:hypothetical protein